MPRKELSQLLRRLHEELERAGTVTGPDRALLQELADDIRAALGEQGAAPQGLGERAGDAVEQFMDSHPTIAFTLRRIVDALGRMGI